MSGERGADHPAADLIEFRWTVSGIQMRASLAERELSYEDTGNLMAESTGEVVEWLAARSHIWDGLDQTRAVTIEIALSATTDAIEAAR